MRDDDDEQSWCSDTSYTVKNKPNKENINFINTNARSLCPKIDSLVDYFEELQLAFACISETWFADGEGFEEDLQDLSLGAGITLLCRNRSVNGRSTGHGGVALAYRNTLANFRKINIPNPDNYEILPVIGNLRGHSRKIVIINCYIPPNYVVKRGKECLDYVSDVVVEVKRRYTDPYLVIMGDFNQWDLGGGFGRLPLIV